MKKIILGYFIFVCLLCSCTSSDINDEDCNCGKVIQASTFNVYTTSFTVVKVKNNCTGVVSQFQMNGVIKNGSTLCGY